MRLSRHLCGGVVCRDTDRMLDPSCGDGRFIAEHRNSVGIEQIEAAVDRATVRQRKTGRPVRSELSEQTRQAVDDYIKAAGKKPGEFLFSSRGSRDRCITTRQYARLVARWIATIGLDPHFFGTHSACPLSTRLLTKDERSAES